MITKIGNWLFHYRNILFPVFYLCLFIPSGKIFESQLVAMIVGSIIILLGMSVRMLTIGLVYIERGGRNRRIHANELVVEGIYKMCRNPMYLGNMLLLGGFGIFANSLLFVVIIFPVFLFIYYAIIKAEEVFLNNKFGEKYQQYRNNVNAIFPDFSKLKAATKGIIFKWKKVLVKEHTSLFIYFAGILLILLYNNSISLSVFSILFLLLVIIYATIRYHKKKGRLREEKDYNNNLRVV